MRLLPVFAVALAAIGCHPSPESTLDAWQRALRDKKLDRAYALMSNEYRRTHDLATFSKAVADRREAKGPMHVVYEAELSLESGDKLPLILENNEWRLAKDPLDVYPQSTPADALRSFVRAVENKRFEVVLRFVPQRYRASLTVDKIRARWEGERATELAAQLAEVRHHLGEPFELVGDDALLPLGDRKQVRLTREEDGWKVIQIE
jgi:hypothetical protein